MKSQYRELKKKDEKSDKKNKQIIKSRIIPYVVYIRIISGDVGLLLGFIFSIVGFSILIPFLVAIPSGVFPIWVIIILCKFPIVGLSLLIVRTIYIYRIIYLLKYGEIGLGKIINTEPTNVTVNNQRVYKFVIEFVAKDKKKYTSKIKTHKIGLISNNSQEKLLYNIRNPKRVVLIDILPEQVNEIL